MKINKKLGAFVLALGLSFAYPVHTIEASSALIIENQEIKDLEKLENFDKASTREVEEYQKIYDTYLELFTKDKAQFDAVYSENNLDAVVKEFGKDYEARLELAKAIEMVKKIDPVNFSLLINDSVKILNALDMEAVASQKAYIDQIISEKENELKEDFLAYSLSEEETKDLEEKTLAFINEGRIFENEALEDKERLELAKKAVINSKDYLLANEDIKTKYDEILETLREKPLENNFDYKLAYSTLVDFLDSDDKANFEKYEVFVSDDDINTNFIASNETTGTEDSQVETTTIENGSPTSETESAVGPEESAFVKNKATSTRYNELTDPQKRELDAIDTNKDGILTDDEINNSANYQTPIDESSWLYPFTEAGIAAADSSSESPEYTTEDTDTTEEVEEEYEEVEEETTNDGASAESDQALPNTVTIDDDAETRSPELEDDEEYEYVYVDEDEEEDDEDEYYDDEEDELDEADLEVEPVNTNAATIVKTGIGGVGIFVIILLVAIGAYYFLSKDKKNNNNQAR